MQVGEKLMGYRDEERFVPMLTLPQSGRDLFCPSADSVLAQTPFAEACQSTHFVKNTSSGVV